MFPLKNRKLIRGYQAHIKAGLGGAADYRADHVPLYAPFDGFISTYYGQEGGNWSRLTRLNGDKLEFAHLSKYIAAGSVKEGQEIAITGNTGSITDYPHLHIQIIGKDGKRKDPEAYQWETQSMPTNIPIKLILNAPWQDLARQTSEVASRYLEASAQRLNLSFEPIYTNFTNIPWEEVPGAPGYTWIRRDWMDANIVPLAGGKPIVAFWLPKSQWAGQNAVGWQGDHDQGPIELQITGDENEMWPNPSMPYFVNNLSHEIAHGLKVMTGQPQNVHDFLLRDKFDLKGFCDTLDYQAINNYLGSMVVKHILTSAKLLTCKGVTAITSVREFQSTSSAS